tara:strand:- start:2794 stop:3294 length:501 start_codon:yes stop_codon:yes gene_type:complete
MNISLSATQVLNLLDNKANFVQYSDLHKIPTIDELLGQYKKCVLLYQTSRNYGHYVALWEYNDTIFFFDSYGGIVDSQLKYVPPDLKDELNSNHNYLIRLMYNSGKKVEFNQYALQSREPDVSTCGRWTVNRLRFPEISINEYHDIFKQSSKYISNDELIVLLVPL